MAGMVRSITGVFCLTLCTLVSAQEIDVQPTPPATLGQKVNVQLEIRGNVVADLDGENATSLPMEVDGKFAYRERQLRSQRSTRYLREYLTAEARIDHGRGQTIAKLEDGNDWIVVDRRTDPDQTKRVRFLTSTEGLSQSELDL